MRAVRIPNAKPINSDALISELTTAGIPVGFKGVYISGTDVVVSLPDTLQGDSQYDATINAVYQAHVAPSDKTPSEMARQEAADALQTQSDKIAHAIRVLAKMVNASLNQIRPLLGLPTVSWATVETQFRTLLLAGQGDPETVAGVKEGAVK